MRRTRWPRAADCGARWVGRELRAGNCLEEIASARVRGLLSSQAGREALGLGHVADELVFIEGSRIRDATGTMLTDGVIGIRRGGELEIVAVLEAKAGHFAAGGLTESVAGLRRTTRATSSKRLSKPAAVAVAAASSVNAP